MLGLTILIASNISSTRLLYLQFNSTSLEYPTTLQKLARMSDHDGNLRIAHEAEKDLNTYQAKQGLGRKSDSSTSSSFQSACLLSREANLYIAVESGVNEMVEKKFGDTGIKTGREAGASSSDRKPIPEDEGGSRDDRGR
jgi:hypothetical protein